VNLNRLPRAMVALAILSIVPTGLGWNTHEASPAYCLVAALFAASWGGIGLIEIALMADRSPFGLLSSSPRAIQFNAFASVALVVLTGLGAATVHHASAWLYFSLVLLLGSDACFFVWLRMVTRTLRART